MAVSIDAGSSPPVIGTPRELFQLHPPHSIGSLDVTPDGERFLIAVLDSDEMQQVVTARLNWAASLESRQAR